MQADIILQWDLVLKKVKNMNKPTWLLDHKQNVYSQSGEDGIIENILDIITPLNKWCVEFGAHDGKTMSNTRNLIENKNYSSILIEGDKRKFIELQKNYLNNNKVITINQFVGFEGEYTLDKILKKTCIPVDFDFLSIDVDGNDYHIWSEMLTYKPKVICVEFNPTIPTNIEFVQSKDMSVNQGSSLLSLMKLGVIKGYELVSVLDFNAFFIRKEYYPLFQIENNTPEVMRTNLDSITYFFQGFDGTIFLRGNMRLSWHGVDLKESKIQHLPKFLRKRNLGTIELMILQLWILFLNPNIFIIKLKKIVSGIK